MVVKRGVNEARSSPMAAHFRGTGHVLRFIEYMDVGTTNGWRMDDVVPAAEIIETIDAEWPLEPVGRATAARSPSRYRYRDGGGEIGVIASVTQPFCGDCTRARLSADGQLYTCLFAAAGHDLRARCAAAPATRTSRAPAPRSGAGAPTATPSCARAETDAPAEGRDVAHRRLGGPSEARRDRGFRYDADCHGRCVGHPALPLERFAMAAQGVA